MPKDDKPPAFQFYPDDFSSDGIVEAMTTTEVGAYILLLCKAWREEPPGSIPNDDRVLARWTRLTPGEWAECRTGVLAAFTLGIDTRWHQKRLRKEYQKLVAYQKERSETGRKGAISRWLSHRSAIGLANAPPLAKNGSSSSSSSSSSKKFHSLEALEFSEEKPAMEAAELVLGEKCMKQFGGVWRKRYRENAEKFKRVVTAMLEEQNERTIQNPGGYADDLWKRFAE